VNNYNYNDDITALLNTGLTQVYYRLKQVDYNGKYVYSNTAVVTINNVVENPIQVNPNPFKNELTIKVVEQESTTASLFIIDANGKQVQSATIQLNKGENTSMLTDLDGLSSGIYFVHIITATGNSHMVKVCKQ
jgi:hypothetical protein